jgi:hypothetical protein
MLNRDLCLVTEAMSHEPSSAKYVMAETDSKSWQFNRQINVSVLVQLVLLASLIVGSWVNLQRQLDLLQRDVSMLLQCQKNVEQKLESLSAKSISYDYRLRVVEKRLSGADITDEAFWAK